MSLDRKKLLRTEIMQWVYEKTDSDESVFVDLNSFPNSGGYDQKEIWAAIKYLEGECLLKPLWVNGDGLPQTEIAHHGVTEVEQAMENKANPTEHFVAFDTINIVNVSGNFSANQFQQSGAYSSQSNATSNLEESLIKLLFDEINSKLDQFKLSEDLENELKAEMTIASAELSKGSPRRDFLKNCLASILGILTSVLSEMAVHEILQNIWVNL